MLLSLDISSSHKSKIEDPIKFIDVKSSSPIFKSTMANNISYQQDQLEFSEFKIKYFNENYYVFYNNSWILIQSNDQFTYRDYTIVFQLIPQNRSLPVGLDSILGEELQELTLLNKGLLNTIENDPLHFLYKTPAHSMIKNPLNSKDFIPKSDTYMIPTFWHSPKREQSDAIIHNSESLLLSYSLPKTIGESDGQ